MTQGQFLQRKLLSFVRSRHEVTGWASADFGSAAGLLQLVQLELFDGFEWSHFQGPHGLTVFGIRVDQGAKSKGEIAANGFRIESMVNHSLIVRLGLAERYLVVELLSPEQVAMSACAYCPPGDWYVLEEHLLVRARP